MCSIRVLLRTSTGNGRLQGKLTQETSGTRKKGGWPDGQMRKHNDSKTVLSQGLLRVETANRAVDGRLVRGCPVRVDRQRGREKKERESERAHSRTRTRLGPCSNLPNISYPGSPCSLLLGAADTTGAVQ